MGKRYAGSLRGVCWTVLLFLQGAGPLGWSESVLGIVTQTLQVKATLVPGCSVTRGGDGVLGILNFGTYSGVTFGGASARFVPNGSLMLACTPGVALTMRIDGGKNYTTVRNLQRRGGTEQVAYRLYSSSSPQPGSEIGVDRDVAITWSDSNNISLPLYGVAQLSGLSPAGSYSDQLTVTLSW